MTLTRDLQLVPKRRKMKQRGQLVGKHANVDLDYTLRSDANFDAILSLFRDHCDPVLAKNLTRTHRNDVRSGQKRAKGILRAIQGDPEGPRSEVEAPRGG